MIRIHGIVVMILAFNMIVALSFILLHDHKVDKLTTELKATKLQIDFEKEKAFSKGFQSAAALLSNQSNEFPHLMIQE